MKLFLTSVASESIDEIVPKLPKKPQELKVVYIPTAADTYPADNRPWFDADKKSFTDRGFKVEDFNLVGKTQDIIREKLSNADIIFVSGGNTFYLLEHAKKSGFDKALKELKDSDKIYIGSSAGSILVGPSLEPIQTLDHPEEANLDSFDAIGLVDFVILPHWARDKYADRHKKISEDYGDKYNLKTVSDGEMVEMDL